MTEKLSDDLEILERCKAHIYGICSSFEHMPLSVLLRKRREGEAGEQEVKEYKFNAKKARLKYFSERMQAMGYNYQTQEFNENKMHGINGIFRNPNADPNTPEVYIVGHHDFVLAGQGATDNASALAIMLEVAEFFAGSPFNIVFASFDFEEMSCLGSHHYVNSLSADEIAKIDSVISLECLGGEIEKDVIVCTSAHKAECDLDLVREICEISSHLNTPFVAIDCPLFSSDHVPFAQAGVKVTGICGLDVEIFEECGRNIHYYHGKTGSIIHSNRDTPENITGENMPKVVNTLIEFLYRHKAPN